MISGFRVGDLVRVRPNGRSRAQGIHEVVEVIPSANAGERQYRLRSARAAAEQTVSERDICRA